MLQIDVEQKLQWSISTLVGKMAAVLGITGSGKTNTAAVLIEELLSHGLPMTVVDIEGEYWGLKERFEILVAGASEHAELKIGPEQAGSLAEFSLQHGISVILDLSDFTPEESHRFLLEYFRSLWTTSTLVRKPYQIVLEEAHEFVPQGVNTPLKQALIRIALRGRKRGLGMFLMSQRSAKVEKDVLTQASLLFLHKVVHPTDMRVYKDLIPLPATDVEALVRALQPGQAIVVHEHTPQMVWVRLRETFHAGTTPEFGTEAPPTLRRIDKKLLNDLRKAIAAAASVPKDEQQFEKRIQQLETHLAEKDAIIAHQAEQIALLSQLTVRMEGTLPNTLEIDQATIHQVQVPGLASVSSQTRVIVSPSASPFSELASPFSLSEAKWDALQERLQQVPSWERAILRVLIAQQRPLTIAEIAVWLNKSERNVQNHPPSSLVKLGIVTRTRWNRGYRYRSALADYLSQEFPGMDSEQLQARLLR